MIHYGVLEAAMLQDLVLLLHLELLVLFLVLFVAFWVHDGEHLVVVARLHERRVALSRHFERGDLIALPVDVLA